MIPRHQIAVRPSLVPASVPLCIGIPFSPSFPDLAFLPGVPEVALYPHAVLGRAQADKLWISETLSPLRRICCAQLAIHPTYGLILGYAHPKMPPRLCGVRLGHLLDLDGVVDLAVC